MLYETIDNVLYPHEITMLLDKAILLCPVMRRSNCWMYPLNVEKAIPNMTDEFYILGAALLNDFAFNLGT